MKAHLGDKVGLAQLCIGYLNGDLDLPAYDALKTLQQMDDQTLAKAASGMASARLRQLVKNKQVDVELRGLCAYLLGHAGDVRDAVLLRELLASAKTGSDADGLLKGWLLLDPQAAWDYITQTLRDPRSDFLTRDLMRRCARYYLDSHPGQIEAPRVREVYTMLLMVGELDWVVEDLRLLRRWDLTDEVVGLWKQDLQDLQRRAILRFCVQCPDARAAALVAEQRRANAEVVARAERELRW